MQISLLLSTTVMVFDKPDLIWLENIFFNSHSTHIDVRNSNMILLREYNLNLKVKKIK